MADRNRPANRPVEMMDLDVSEFDPVAATMVYFSPQEWEKIVPIKREQMVSQMRNYHFLRSLGLPTSVPDFVKDFQIQSDKKKSAELRRQHTNPKAKRIKTSYLETGDKKIVKLGRGRYGYRCVKKKVVEKSPEKRVEKSTEQERGWQDEAAALPPEFYEARRIWREEDAEERKQQEENKRRREEEKKREEEKPRRYPQRNVARPNYREDPEPDDDDYFYCDHCGFEVLGVCQEHGKPFRILDEPVPRARCSNKAERSLPSGFRVSISSIPNAGLGVFTDHPIPAFTQLGPYVGRLIPRGNNDGYCWQIRRTGTSSLSVDAQDLNNSNWMRFVDCARHDSEQNLSPYQYQGQIFYMTRRLIMPGEELLTWYGAQFMKDLGIDMANYFKPLPENPFYRRVGKALQCVFCPLGFSAEIFIQRHVHRRHNSAHSKLVLQHKATVIFPPSRTCTSLGVLFSQGEISNKLMDKEKRQTAGGAVKKYMSSGSGEKRHKCTQCEYATDNKTNFNNHMRTHTGEKPYQCEICDYTCAQSGHLSKHIRIHSGEKPYQCTICDFASSDSSSLSSHIRIHTGEKPYKCTICDYTCTVSSSLSSHMRTHTGEKPYQCSKCDSSFTVSSHLSRHMRTHTGE